MLKSSEEALTKIPILKYDGRQTSDFTAWKNPSPPQWDKDTAYIGLQDRRQLRIRRTSSTRWECNQVRQHIRRFGQSYVPWTNARVQESQSIPSTNIQLYSRLYNKLHEDTCKKLIDDPLWAEIERKQDPKGLMTAVTKIMLLASSGNTHQDTHRARMIHHALRQQEKESL